MNSEFKKYNFRVLLLAIGLLIQSCAEENPDLVNPPPQSKTVRVRFINFASDGQERKLGLDGEVFTETVGYGECSEAVQPPADSSYPSVVLNGSTEFRASNKIRFLRDNYYTVFGLPSAPGDSIQRDLDTLISVGTLAGLPQERKKAYIKIFNAYPDSNRTYSMKRGCPNGEPLATNVSYRKASPQMSVRSNGVPISILRTKAGETEFLGLFNLFFDEGKQYMVVIGKESNSDEEKIYLLDEFNDASQAFGIETPELSLTTQMRAINVSNAEVTFAKQPDEIVGDGVIQTLNSKYVGAYNKIGACSSRSLDSLYCLVGGDTASYESASLDVSERYTIIAFDSSTVAANLSVLTEPYRVDDYGNAIIRVVHAAYMRQTVTLSMAARDDNPYSDQADSLGYLSGDVIAEDISYGEISEPRLVKPGENLPITMFTTTQPARLLNCAVGDIQPGGRYLMLLTTNGATGEDEFYLIEKNTENAELEPLTEGVFTQIVNLVPDAEQIELRLDPTLTRAKMNYGASLATVVAEGERSLTMLSTGDSYVIGAEKDKRNLTIIAGEIENPDFLEFSYEPLDVSVSFYQRRFINASKGVSLLSIKLDDDDESNPFTVERIAYGRASRLQNIEYERNLSIFFINSETNNTLLQVNDLPFPLGKNYSVIFGGSEAQNNYTGVVLQEY